MAQSDLAIELLKKAAQDQLVLDRLLGDPEVATETLGFHAQQAVEKLLKAVLAHAGVEYPFTHRLEELIDAATDNGIALPAWCEELRLLTPFAVQYRYEALLDGPEGPLDLRAVQERIGQLRAWVEAHACTGAKEQNAQ